MSDKLVYPGEAALYLSLPLFIKAKPLTAILLYPLKSIIYYRTRVFNLCSMLDLWGMRNLSGATQQATLLSDLRGSLPKNG